MSMVERNQRENKSLKKVEVMVLCTCSSGEKEVESGY